MNTEVEEEFCFPMVPSSSNIAAAIAADIAQSTTIVEEGPSICPLCNSIVKPFFVNFNEKILMCENTVCEFPFCDKLRSFREDSELPVDVEVASVKTKPSQWSQGSGSLVSATEWSEIERMNQAYESEQAQAVPNVHPKKLNQKVNEFRKSEENEEKIQENVEKIKQLNKVLFESGEDMECIRNEKWIKNLFTMQASSGLQLLKEQELKKLKKTQPNIEMGELKIDIGSSQDSIPSIKIDISREKDVGDKQITNP